MERISSAVGFLAWLERSLRPDLCLEKVQEWRYRFARDVLSQMADKLTSARPIKYSEILELDRKIQSFEAHPFATQGLPKGYDASKLSFRMSPANSIWYRETCMYYKQACV